jgi:beta-ureidopropionase / N-carbamoyl-L-amino-acid hydrolase
MEVDPPRVVAGLRELHALTGGEDGARRLAWTDTWAAARRWMAERLDGLPVDVSDDAAGNRWITLRGERAESVVIGSHIDSVPGGGWLDGVLGLLGGLEVLRALAARGAPPPVTVRLVDWADEEGARFGYGCLGSSAAARTVDPAELGGLADAGGTRLADALAAHGVELARILDAAVELQIAAAYVELHIEQGPVLEGLGLPLGVVLGTSGVERHTVRFHGQAAHAGSTPMDARRDPLAAAARLLLAVREPAREAGGVATVGRCTVEPGIVTAVPGACEIALDQRHLDPAALRDLLEAARRAAAEIAAGEGVEVTWRRLWRIEPVAFHPELIALADASVREVAGASHRLPSGPLHDAAEVARAGVPTVMLFAQSLRGLSHTREEDTRPEHLELAVRALARTVERTIAWVSASAP